MKHFVIYRKLILIIGTATAVVSVGVFFFMEDILFRTLFISFAFVFFGGLLFLLDFLHNRYNDISACKFLCRRRSGSARR